METKEIEKIINDEQDVSEKEYCLVVWNDEVNTFDWVITAFMDICNYPIEQATQLTYFVHYKGKAEAKIGDYKTLNPLRKQFVVRTIHATLERIN